MEELEERLPGFDEQVKLSITGCPNSRGQHWIAGLGVEGKKIKADGWLQDAYYFCVGGAVESQPSIARPVGYRCLASEVLDAAARLCVRYGQLRLPGEDLRQFFGRRGGNRLPAYGH